MVNYWNKMYDDSYALKRVHKAVKMLYQNLHMANPTVAEVGSFEEVSYQFLMQRFHVVDYHPYDCQQFTKNTILLDLEKPFKLIPSDAILCLEVLEHLVKPGQVLKELTSSLNKDGLIVVSLPNEATLFHRLRGLSGTIDAECFSACGKHLHLPSLHQARSFLKQHGDIIDFYGYINPSATGSRQGQLLGWMRLIPDWVWQLLADLMPSLFARGWIFVLKPRQNAPASTAEPLS